MSDIVTRLRTVKVPENRHIGFTYETWALEAADEIDRLRGLLAAYVADEDRFNRGQGEPYGSIPTEIGILARAVVKRN